MKALIILLVGINIYGCSFRSSSGESNQIAQGQMYETDDCGNAFRHKSESELASMAPKYLLEEAVNSQLRPDSFKTYTASADYDSLVSKFVRKAGARTLPVLTEYMDMYDPRSASACEEMRLSVATRFASDLDRFDFRLRATKDGRLAIKALERSIQRMKEAGFDKSESEYEYNRRFRLYSLYLKELNGTNEVDRAIRDTFWVRYKVQISDTELLELSNFLISRDPAYPSWSGARLIKDDSRINEAGNPLQVFVLENPQRYYEAYLQFKKTSTTQPTGSVPKDKL